MSSKGKGVQPKRSAVAKPVSAEVLAAMKQPLPAGQLDAAPQSFAGEPAPPKGRTQARVFAAAAANPLLNPLPGPLPPRAPAPAGPSLPKAPVPKRKQLRMVKKTPDYIPRRTAMDPGLKDSLDEINPVFGQYDEKQAEIESHSPYMTDIVVYTPQTRKSYYRFISESYNDQFKLIPQVKGKIDEDACAKLGAAAGTAVESFLYQKFVREYIRNASPYRGMLVYHGLGSGKTCSAIAAAEALYGTANKKIIVMTPFSLRGNFMSEISFCGFRHFNTQNHWVSESLISAGGITYIYGKSVLSLSDWFLKKVLERPEDERKVIWIPDFSKSPNYDELTQQERDDIRAQITNMIENRVKFISYNGVTASELKRYACKVDPETGDRMFDNAVIVIDEIHNLTRLMQGEITPYTTKRKGRARKIPVEPITPGKWQPGLCTSELNYKRSYLFYKLLSDARNSKIIGLSGTPIINFPDELGVLANVLGGYIECAEVILNSVDKETIEKVRKIAEAEPRVDIVRFRTRAEKMELLVSVFNEGYERVTNEDTGEFIGVKYNADAQEGIRSVFERIKGKLLAEKVPIGAETYISYPRLPVDDKEFKDEFIDPINLSVKNKTVLQKRLTGLISYYRGSKEEYMPRVTKDEVIRCEMSDYVLSMYTVERNREIKGEKQKSGEAGDNYAIVEQFAKMKNPSSYRFRSRALCNFAFPKGIERPFPDSLADEEEEVAQTEDVAIAEGVMASEEDLAAQELVAAEEATIPDAEEEGDEEGEEEEEKEGEENKAEEGEEEKEAAEDAERTEEGALEGVVKSMAAAVGLGVTQGGGEGDDDQPAATGEAAAPAEASATAVPAAAAAPPAEPPAQPVQQKRKRPQVAPPAAQPQPVAVAAPATGPVAPAPPAARTPRRKPQVAPPVAAEAKVEEAAEELQSETGAELEAEQEAAVTRTLTYQERIKRAMDRLGANKDKYLKLDATVPEGRLSQYSTKLDQMIRRIQISKGSNLVYSQFKTVEGLGVLRLALQANGFVEIDIEGGEWMPRALRATADNSLRFSQATIESLRKGPDAKEKRFMFLTGEGLREKRNLLLNIFNGAFDKIPESMRRVLEESGYGERKNRYGEICWVFGITGAGAEGISLKCCRSVHIMEPYWNKVRLDQVKGRAIRICSHQDLPFKDREVDIYTYYTVFSAEQKNKNKIDVTIRQADEDETSDEKVYNVGVKKDRVNQELLDLMKATAMDCGLNGADNDAVSCFVVDGRPDQYIFDPNLEVDKILTSIEFKEDKQIKQEEAAPAAATAAIMKQLGAPAQGPRTKAAQLIVMEWEGVEYLLYPKPKSGGLVFNLYARADDTLRNPLGEIAVNPATGTLDDSEPVFKASGTHVPQ
jgi:hypothetical protein